MITVKKFLNLAASATVTFPTYATFIRCVNGNNNFRIEGYWKSDKLLDWDGFSSGESVDEIGVNETIGDDGAITRTLQVVDTITITNGLVPQDIWLVVGDGKTTDNRLTGLITVSGGINAIDIGATTGSQLQASSLATVGTTIVSPVGNDMEALIQNTSAIAVEVFLGAVVLGQGILLEPKQAGANVGGSVNVSSGLTWKARPLDGVTLTGRVNVTQTSK